jgi:hypothetical protein
MIGQTKVTHQDSNVTWIFHFRRIITVDQGTETLIQSDLPSCASLEDAKRTRADDETARARRLTSDDPKLLCARPHAAHKTKGTLAMVEHHELDFLHICAARIPAG